VRGDGLGLLNSTLEGHHEQLCTPALRVPPRRSYLAVVCTFAWTAGPATVLMSAPESSRKVAEVLPVLYLRGLFTGDFRAALAALLGKDAAGLSATNIARQTNEWETEYRAFQKRSARRW
jgi:hypothetical protein